MRTKYTSTALLILPFSIVAATAAPIQNLTFTEVVKDVFVIDPATKKETPAKAGDTLVPPNVLKTGADSRAELVAEDKTVTRVGSNTIFSVEANSRDVNLAQGSVLFHSPAGRGGGRIKSAGATASVLGTTLAVSANADGGFKTSLLEGKGEVRDPKGGKVGLVAGQVTFAKPGGGLSPALNFDLKAQISNSKLVGGFSAPLASIAKIEAAVAVQQAKIAGGALVNTGMLIGDRPDTAFKVDATIVDGQIRQAKTRVEEQVKATKELQRWFDVDPRFTDFVLNDTRNSLTYNSPSQNVSNLYFYIDGTGRSYWRDYLEAINDGASVGVPSKLPGNRLTSENVFYPIIQKNISITLNADKEESAFFLPSPIDPRPLANQEDDTLAEYIDRKVSGGLVALDDIHIGGNIEFANLDNVDSLSEGVEIGLALLLSAGRTISIDEGSQIVSKGNLLEIYAGGTQFSRDKDLKQRPLAANEKPADFSINTVKITNESQAADGLLRITAPSIELANTALVSSGSPVVGGTLSGKYDADHFSEISLEASGSVVVGNSNSLYNEKQAKSVRLGFNSPDDICLTAFKISINSKTSAVSLTNLNLKTNRVALSAAQDIHIVDTIVTAQITDSFSNDLDIVAGGDVSIRSNDDPSRGAGPPVNRAWFNTFLDRSNISSTNGDVTLENVWFGDANRIATGSDAKVGGSFEVKAANAILLTNAAVAADVVLFDGRSVQFSGVTIVSNSAENGSKIEVKSREPIRIAGASRYEAYTIKFDADNQVVGVQSPELSTGGNVKARAVHELSMRGVDLRYAQNVALEANTVVLGDVSFKEGSAVTLTSTSGILSTPTDRAQVTKGWVNVLPRVMYGTNDLHDLKHQMTSSLATASGLAEVSQTATVGIPGTNVAQAIKNQFPNSNINLTVKSK